MRLRNSAKSRSKASCSALNAHFPVSTLCGRPKKRRTLRCLPFAHLPMKNPSTKKCRSHDAVREVVFERPLARLVHVVFGPRLRARPPSVQFGHVQVVLGQDAAGFLESEFASSGVQPEFSVFEQDLADSLDHIILCLLFTQDAFSKCRSNWAKLPMSIAGRKTGVGVTSASATTPSSG